MAQNNASRVQVTLMSPDAIKAWGQVPRGLKAKALEQAILLLQKNKTLAPMFFSEVVEGNAAVEVVKKSQVTEKPSQAQKPNQTKNSEDDKKGKVVEEW